MFEKRAVLFSSVARLFDSSGMPLKPTIDDVQRSMNETEVLTFSSLSDRDLHRFRLAIVLDKLVNKYMPVLPNFTKRSMAEMGGDWQPPKDSFHEI